MDQDERRHLRDRRKIVAAYAAVLDDPERLWRAISTATDDEGAVGAVSDAFGLDEVAARALLDLQIRRFAPHQVRRLRNELDELDTRIAELDR